MRPRLERVCAGRAAMTPLRRRTERRLAAAAVLCLLATSACSPMVHVTTAQESTGDAIPGNPVQVDLRVLTDALEVAISNRGEVPVDVLWDEAVMVDTEGNTSPVVHSNIAEQWAAPDVSGDVSRIPPHAMLTAFLIPDRSVIFERGSGWYAQPLLPVECGPLRCIGYHELVGRTVQLTLPMRVNGADRVMQWTLRITDAIKSVRGARPPEMPLYEASQQ